MKRLAAVAVLILLADALAGQTPTTFAPRDGGFRVTFPGKPKESSTNAKTDLGRLRVFTATFATPANDVFLVSYTDYPEGTATGENADALLDGVRDGLKGKDRAVLEDSAVKVGGRPGREFVLGDDRHRVRVIALLRGDRLFQVGVVGSKEFVAGKDAAAFLKSFEPK